MALVVRFIVREPPRGAIEGRTNIGEQPAVGDAIRLLLGIRSYRQIAIATALYCVASYGFMMWVPTFLVRVHEMGRSESGGWLGLIAAGCGLAGAYTGGWLADYGVARDRRWSCWLPACAGLLTTPFIFAFLLVDSGELALLCYVPIAFLSAGWSAATYAVVQGLVSLRMRAMASAVLLFALNLIGLGLGPQFVGILNDVLNPRFGDRSHPLFAPRDWPGQGLGRRPFADCGAPSTGGPRSRSRGGLTARPPAYGRRPQLKSGGNAGVRVSRALAIPARACTRSATCRRAAAE